jgi:hypothetical protein
MTEAVSGVWRRTVAVLVAGVLGGAAALDVSEAALASAPFAVSMVGLNRRYRAIASP